MRTNLNNISAHVSQSLLQKLEKVAKFEERPKSFYIRKSLERYLDEKLEDMKDYISAKKTMSRAKKKGERFYSLEEVFKDL